MSLDDARLERAADRILALCDELALDWREVTTVCSAIFLNHAFSSGVTEERCLDTVRAMYLLRRRGVPHRVLAKKASSSVSPDDVHDPEPIHTWFELSYSSYFAVQRTVLQSMPTDWQRLFVELLEAAARTLDLTGVPTNFRVWAVDEGGKFIRDPFKDYERGRRRIPRKEPPRG
jgi:hypothetical protein